MWLGLLLVAFSVLVTGTNSLLIQEIKAPVALKDIQFDVDFSVVFERSDEAQGFDSLVAYLSSENELVGAGNFSIYNAKGVRQNVFTISNVVMPLLGRRDVLLGLTLWNANSTVPLEMQENRSQADLRQSVWVIPGGYTLIPLIVTMVIAILTRNVLPALFCGVLTASFLIYQFDLPTAFARSLDSIILTALTDGNNQLVILFAMIMGGFVNMVNESGGSVGLANALATFASSGQSTQAVTLFFGLLIFFDDYASALILGATLRTVADRMSVSREKFTFLVDSGAAPIAALIPITSWTAFESTLLQVEADKLVAAGIDLQALGYETSGFMGLLRMLKYAYYSIYLLFFQVFMIGSKREFGPMFLAERRARIYGVSDERYGFRTPVADGMASEDDFKPPPRCRNAGIPILFFVFYSITAMVVLGAAAVPTHEELALHNIFSNVDSITIMYYGSVLATFVAALVYRIQFVSIPPRPSSVPETGAVAPQEEDGVSPPLDGRVVVNTSPGVCTAILCCRSTRRRRPILTCTKSIEAFVHGFTHLTSTIMVLVLAWSIGAAVDYIGAGRYLATSLEGNVPSESLPVLIFLIACIVAFCTGSSWATMAVLYPICGPIAFQMSNGVAEIYYCSMAAILEGSVFGDHCSFISDTTIMSAMACRCPLTLHVITQLPYAFFVAAVCLSCGYLPIGMQSLTVIETYFVGFAVIVAGILILGARPDGTRLDLLNWISVQFKTKVMKVDPEKLDAVTLMRIPIGNNLAQGEEGITDHLRDQSKPKAKSGNTNEAAMKKTLRRPSFETQEEDIEHRRHREHTEEHRPVDLFSNSQVNPFEMEVGIHNSMVELQPSTINASFHQSPPSVSLMESEGVFGQDQTVEASFHHQCNPIASLTENEARGHSEENAEIEENTSRREESDEDEHSNIHSAVVHV